MRERGSAAAELALILALRSLADHRTGRGRTSRSTSCTNDCFELRVATHEDVLAMQSRPAYPPKLLTGGARLHISLSMKHVCRDGLRPSAGPTHAPPPRSRNFSRRALQQRWHFTLQSSAATCLRKPVAQVRTRWQAPCLAHAASPAAIGCYPEQQQLAQQLRWRVVRKVAWAAACCAACVSLASSMQAAAPFAAASLTFRSAAQTGLRGAARSAAAGFGAGVLHTLAGADHLAALTPLTFGHGHVKASLLGALWGLGHSTGQLILGLMMVVLKDRFNSLVPALAKWGGTSVGLSLVCIGVMGLMELRAEAQAAQQEQLSSQPASANSQFAAQEAERARWSSQPALATEGASFGGESYASTPAADSSSPKSDGVEKDFSIGTFITGVLYGLQPDALFVIVPALTLPTKLAAAAYCLMFVLGTVGAMGGYTAVIGACSKAIKDRNPWLTTNLNALASAVAVGVGATVLASEWGFGF